MAGAKKASAAWVQFPYKDAAYEFGSDRLKGNWTRLHAGDLERWPDAKRAGAWADAGHDGPALSGAVQEAWRAFHRGDFEAAWRAGRGLGPLGAAAAVKAAGVHGAYLEKDAGRAERLLLEAATLAERAATAAPDYANAHYFHAFALGRYSQRVSVLRALAEGHAARIRRSLERVLQLEPKHPDAHIALGVYHAEIVAKVGGIAARLTYGASAGAAEDCLEKAVALNPASPVGPLEYANALVMMHGSKARERARELYRRAAACTPADAMERLDAERARQALATLRA